MMPSRALIVVVCVAGAACGTDAQGGQRTATASLYPLAYAAERIAGPGWRVIDLTPPGAEAHDIELSLEDRSLIARADLQLVLDPAFQPQVWRAGTDSGGVVRAISDEALEDPHLWLSPGTYLREIVRPVLDAFVGFEHRSGDRGYDRRFEELREELRDLAARYFRALRPGRCRYRTVIVSHEAFGYLARDYGLAQLGLAGLTPEAEPGHDRIVRARRLIEGGEAGAVFYERGEDSERIARSVADDAGVPALPLSTLESRPPQGDYLTVMADNLDSLAEGLGCR